MKIARIYLRVSTDEQDLTRQAEIEHSTRSAGYYIAGVYREKASGARVDRPELLRMIADLQPGEVVVADRSASPRGNSPPPHKPQNSMFLLRSAMSYSYAQVLASPLEAARNRFRPIAMTTLAAILTLMPLALAIGAGSGMQQPLAIAIISGLLAQFPLVLLTMPVLIGLTLPRNEVPREE